MAKHSHIPCASTYISKPHNSTENTTSISPTQTYNIPKHFKVKKHYLQQRPLHNRHSHISPHSYYNRHKTKHARINTYIVSRHLATRGTNNILSTPLPYISSSEGILLRLTRRTLAQSRKNIVTFLKSYFHRVDAKSHPSPLFHHTLTHTQHTPSLQLRLHTHHVITPRFVDRPLQSNGNAGQMDRDPTWWTTRGKIELPRTSKGLGSEYTTIVT